MMRLPPFTFPGIPPGFPQPGMPQMPPKGLPGTFNPPPMAEGLGGLGNMRPKRGFGQGLGMGLGRGYLGPSIGMPKKGSPRGQMR